MSVSFMGLFKNIFDVAWAHKLVEFIFQSRDYSYKCLKTNFSVYINFTPYAFK